MSLPGALHYKVVQELLGPTSRIGSWPYSPRQYAWKLEVRARDAQPALTASTRVVMSNVRLLFTIGQWRDKQSATRFAHRFWKKYAAAIALGWRPRWPTAPSESSAAGIAEPRQPYPARFIEC